MEKLEESLKARIFAPGLEHSIGNAGERKNLWIL
jgi:hypothetical protein